MTVFVPRCTVPLEQWLIVVGGKGESVTEVSDPLLEKRHLGKFGPSVVENVL